MMNYFNKTLLLSSGVIAFSMLIGCSGGSGSAVETNPDTTPPERVAGGKSGENSRKSFSEQL